MGPFAMLANTSLPPVTFAQPALVELIFSDVEMSVAGVDKATGRVFYSPDGTIWSLLDSSVRREGDTNIGSVFTDRSGIFSLAADRYTLLLPTTQANASAGW